MTESFIELTEFPSDLRKEESKVKRPIKAKQLYNFRSFS